MSCVTGREGEFILRMLRSPPRLPDYFRRVSPLLRSTLLLTLATCILIAGVSFSWPRSPEAVTVFAPRHPGGGEGDDNFLASLFHWLPLDYREVLFQGLPLLRYGGEKGEEASGPKSESFWERAVNFLAWIDISDPRSIVMGQVPLLRQVSFTSQDREENKPFPRREVATVNLPCSSRPPANLSAGEPRVAIFHTHALRPLFSIMSHIDEKSRHSAGGPDTAEVRKKGIPVLHVRPHDLLSTGGIQPCSSSMAAILEQHLT